MLKRFFHAAILMLLAALSVPAAAATQGVATAPIKRGVNILGYDPIWENAARARFQQRHFAEIRAGGFDFVRVNLHAFRHMDEENKLSPEFLSRLDWVVKEATDAGLSVILDEHDFMACAENVATCRSRLAAFWTQVAPHYSDAPDSVMFELLNEPHGPLDAATWNSLFPELLAIVRQSNPTRWVVIGPTQWNHFSRLPSLELPQSDRRILATFHYYEPFNFTHQGASWAGDVKNLSGITWGSEADRAKLRSDFAEVAAWSKATGRPVLLGEFGAYDESGTPEAMRLAYIEAVAREAERNGFAWAYWQFDSDFIVWDMEKRGWVEPVRRALIPAE
jgi:endoglucanase